RPRATGSPASTPCAPTSGSSPRSSGRTRRRPPGPCATTWRRPATTSPPGGAAAAARSSGRRRRGRRRSGVRAFVVHAPGGYALTDVPDPRPGPGEVLVAPAAVGICGSDLELLDGRRPPEYVRYPVVPGHEWSGHVVACGAGVADLEPGAPVVAEGVRACGTCPRCREGRANLCAGPYAETGFTHPGALAERLVVPAALVHPLPAERPVAPAALLEPAGCVASGLLELGM